MPLGVFLAWCLWQGRAEVRQERLNQALASAILSNQDQEAIKILAHGADAHVLYYTPKNAVWWRRLVAIISGKPTRRAPGISLLILAIESSPVIRGETLPPTQDHFTLLERLAEKGSPVNVRDRGGITPLEFAVTYKNYPLTRCLLDHGADVNMPGAALVPVIDRAIQMSDRRVFLLLLQRGADVNLPDCLGEVPLEWARDGDNEEFIKILIAHHARGR